MSNFVISLLVAAGGATWVYTYFARRTGGNAQTAGIVAGIAGIFIFVVVIFITSLIPN